MAQKRLLMVVNVGWFFISHRLPIAIAAQKAGYDVHVATALDPVLDADTPRRIAEAGLTLHEVRFTRSGSSPFDLLRDIADLRRLFSKLRPDVVHLVALKPLLLGGIAARMVGIPRVIMAIPGRGSVFSATGLAAAIRRGVVLVAYRVAYRAGSTRVIFQNVEDRDYFLTRGLFGLADVSLVRGSGADVSRFVPSPEPAGIPVVVLVSRMLREKGIEDFANAAARLNAGGAIARFVLVGDPDHGNPASHTREEIRHWVSEGKVEWWGFRNDVAKVFADCHVVCLPTFYGEGVPKVLIEAAAAGRCIVTTDIPGCRDIVRDNINGLLVPPRAVDKLAAALQKLIEDQNLRRKMGAAGRELATAEFSLDNVIRQTLSVYD